MMDTEEFCLRWNNHHSVLVSVLDKLLEKESMCDVTLAADHQFIRVHRLVLCACSQYFEEMLSKQADKQAFIFLKDVSFPDLKALVDYMYKGEVNVAQEHLTSFLQTAEALDIKGLAFKSDEESQQPSSRTKPSHVPRTSGLKRPNDSVTSPAPSTQPINSLGEDRERIPSTNRQPPAKKVHTIPQESQSTPSNDHFVAVQHKVEPEVELDTTVDQVESEWASQNGDEDWSSSDIGIVSVLPNSDSVPSASANIDYGPERNNDNTTTAPSGTKSKTRNSSNFKAARGDLRCSLACPTCGKRYTHRNSYNRHVNYECSSLEPKFPCPNCGIRFRRKSYVREHNCQGKKVCAPTGQI